MSKTGYSNGFADVPTSKYYKYHGLVRSCNTEPILPPELEETNIGPDPVWELIRNETITINNQYDYIYPYDEFFPDIWSDGCHDQFIDFRRRLYFIEVEVNSSGPGDLWAFHYSHALNCCFYTIQSTCTWFHLTRSEWIWAGSNTLLSFVFVNATAHIKLWRSSTGEEPPTTPLPIFTDHN